METLKRWRPVPYEKLTPGVEAVYTSEDPLTVKVDDNPDILPGYCQLVRFKDKKSEIIAKWSVWNLPKPQNGREPWEDPDINFINDMQAKLDPLDEKTRRLRTHIGHLVPCDNGFPMTVEELLMAIGNGELPDTTFHNGCCSAGRWWSAKTTQPGQTEAMKVIYEVLTGYLDGTAKEKLIEKFPDASGFISRTFGWLGPIEKLTELKKTMLDRILLPFEYLTKRNPDVMAVQANCYEKGGEGEKIDEHIAELAGLPKIYANWWDEYSENLKTITDPKKIELYEICGAISHGLHGLSDCHHSTFRWLENWIYSIGTFKSEIPDRKKGVERERLSRLLFGYVLGLNYWLAGKSEHFLLLDLGYIDLGFDTKNEILRVFAYLGEERTPVKIWLAACLWHTLYMNRPAGLIRHKKLIELAERNEISLRSWNDTIAKN